MGNVIPMFRTKEFVFTHENGSSIIVPFDDVESFVCDGEKSKIPDEALRLIVGEWFMMRTE